MRHAALLGLMLVAACGESEQEIIARLDPMGQTMLEPVRLRALAVPDLIERLQLDTDYAVADIGAGPGFLALPIAARVPNGIVIATDVRADYLDVLARLARAAKLDNIETRVVAPAETGLDPSSIDLALIVQVDHAFADRAAYYRAVVRALKPEGKIAIVNYARFRAANIAAIGEAGLAIESQWEPSPPFFGMLVARPHEGD